MKHIFIYFWHYSNIKEKYKHSKRERYKVTYRTTLNIILTTLPMSDRHITMVIKIYYRYPNCHWKFLHDNT